MKYLISIMRLVPNGTLYFLRGLAISLLISLPALAQPAGATVTYFHNDISGSPMVATDAAGNVVWKEGYKPYGEKTRNEVPSRNGTNKIGYAGSPFDASTGLSYMGARYYDPVIGRFMGIDPVGFQEANIHSFNRYAYANNNPYKFVDPDGRIPVPVIVYAAVRASMWVAQRQAGLAAAATVGAEIATGTAGGGISAAEGLAAKVTATELRVAGQANFQAARAGKLAENGGNCTYCTIRPANEVDHIKSLKSYADDVNAGTLSKAEATKRANAENNLTGACTQCNRGPGGKHAKELSNEPGLGNWAASNGFTKE